MPGAIIIVVVLVIVAPLVFWAILGVVAAVLGKLLKDRAIHTHEGSELIELNT